MKHLFLLFAFLSLGITAHCADKVSSSIPATSLGFRFIHAKTTGGFLEYDFRPDGILILYSYLKVDSTSGPKEVDGEKFQPRFEVEFLTWQFEKGLYDEADKLIIYRGSTKTVSEFRQTSDHVYFREKSWDRLSRPQFFDYLMRETKSK